MPRGICTKADHKLPLVLGQHWMPHHRSNEIQCTKCYKIIGFRLECKTCLNPVDVPVDFSKSGQYECSRCQNFYVKEGSVGGMELMDVLREAVHNAISRSERAFRSEIDRLEQEVIDLRSEVQRLNNQKWDPS